MRASMRVLLALSVGLLLGALVYAKPVPFPGQYAKPAQNSSNTTGQQGGGANNKAAAPPAMSPEETKAYQAIQSEVSSGLDPDKVISLATDFEQKYPNSTMISYIYSFEASAYQQKGDIEKVVDSGEKSLKANPDNLISLLIMASILPQPQLMKGADADKEKKLTEAEADANHAIQLIDQLPKQGTETDEQLKKRRDGIASEPHAALGMIHLQRASMAMQGMDPDELTKSAAEFKQSVESTDHPSPQNYYRLGEVYTYENKLDDAIAAFSKASEVGQGTGIQQYADQQIEALKKKQAQATPPAAH